MAKKAEVPSQSSSNNDLIDVVQRIGVGLLYASTDLGQNSIAQVMGMSDGRVNGILKGVKKPNKK
jgi:DNA-binding transcriptional regulator LsrR (DeoR family)